MSKLFPKSANKLPLQIVIYLFVLGGIATAGVSYYMTPSYTRVGYAPTQPVPFSHSIHAGQLGIDCRYCHVGVDKGPASTVPTAQTCMNCHNQVKIDSPLLAVVRESYETGSPVPWVKVHQVPDYVYFNHSAHITRGVSCVECHAATQRLPCARSTRSLTSRGSILKARPVNCVTAQSLSTTGTSSPRKAALAVIDEAHI